MVPVYHASKRLNLFCYISTHTHTQPFYISLDFSGTTWVSQYQNKHSPTHTYHGHQSSLICFLHLLRSWHPLCSIYMPDSLFHNLSPSFLWSTSWLDTLHFILHIFLHPIIVFFSEHITIPMQPVLL